MPQFLNSLAIWLIDQQNVQSYEKAVLVSKSRITVGFPHKGTVMCRSRVRASPNSICMHESIDSLLCSKSSGWHMKESCSLSRPDDLALGSISSGWLLVNVLCHPDDIRSFPKSPGWHDVSWTLCHPDEIAPGRISSGWLSYFQYLIRMTFGLCRMSSGWLTILPYVIRMR